MGNSLGGLFYNYEPIFKTISITKYNGEQIYIKDKNRHFWIK